jgi:F420-dependent oxidoreductase-like protein
MVLMRLTIFTEPQQGASYDDLLRVARQAEAAGLDGFMRSDHYLTMGAGDGQPGPTDAWITLAGLARDTQRVRLGTLVTPVTFRSPGPLAISIAQVDAMSGGRVDVSLGAGWYEREHRAYGIPFPSTGERFDRLTEQLEILTGLWATPLGERFTYHGRFYQLDESPALPKPVQTPGPHLIIGGRGPKRTPALAARFADEFNAPFASAAEAKALYEQVAAASGREPGRASVLFSAAHTVCVGRDETELTRRAAATGQALDRLRQNAFAGTPNEVVDKIGQYAAAGASRIHLQLLDLSDLDQIDLIASSVAPQL